MSEPKRSGRQARQAERSQKGSGVGRPYIVRGIPTYDILGEENLRRIEAAADRILAETGIEFRDDPQALDLWRALVTSHPHERDVVREAALALLRADAVEEAREVNRAATGYLPRDATIWCNRAVTELLCGDLGEARRCLDRSDALDPADPIAAAVRRRLVECERGAPRPATLRELERRGLAAGGE